VAPPAATSSPAPPPTATKRPISANPPPGRRLRGEDLIADLFEAMHDLNFVRDAIEGGDFCLTLAMEKLPSQAGIVHLYDIDRREFLVTSTRGAGSSKLLLKRHRESDALLSAAMGKRRAVVMNDLSAAEAASAERYLEIGGARSLIVAPVMQSGRFLGAIELINPLDGQPFTEAEGNALSYIAQQFAEFVATRGVVTDAERIGVRRIPVA
jgi:GAF domain-containing protein